VSQPFSIIYTFPCPGSRPTFAIRRDPRPGIEDYQQITNMALQFDDAQHSQIFNVEIFEDAVPEGVEELNVTLILDPASVGIVGERVSVVPAVATVRIQDNDRKFDCYDNWVVPWFDEEAMQFYSSFIVLFSFAE